jgi:hypothetical protein
MICFYTVTYSPTVMRVGLIEYTSLSIIKFAIRTTHTTDIMVPEKPTIYKASVVTFYMQSVILCTCKAMMVC